MWFVAIPTFYGASHSCIAPKSELRSPLFYPSSVPHIQTRSSPLAICLYFILFISPLIFLLSFFVLAGSLFNIAALKFPSVHIWKFSHGEERHTALEFVPANLMIVANKIASIHILITRTASNCIGGKVPVQSCLRPIQMALTVFCRNWTIDRDKFVTYALEGKLAFIPSKALTEHVRFMPISRKD